MESGDVTATDTKLEAYDASVCERMVEDLCVPYPNEVYTDSLDFFFWVRCVERGYVKGVYHGRLPNGEEHRMEFEITLSDWIGVEGLIRARYAFTGSVSQETPE